METSLRSYLLEIRHKSIKIAPSLEEIVCGSVVTVYRKCGKPNCRCQSGAKHRSLYLSQRHNGKTRMTYIPKESEETVFKFMQNYKRLKAIIKRVSEYNMLLFAEPKKRKQK